MDQPPPEYSSVDRPTSNAGWSASQMRFPEPHLNASGSSVQRTGEAPYTGSAETEGRGGYNGEIPRGMNQYDSRQAWTTLTCSRPSIDNFIVRDTNENILYWVENTHEHIFHANPIRVFKPDPRDPNRKVLYATMIMHRLDSSTLELPMEGRMLDLDGVFRHKSWPSQSRLMTTEYGEWKWSYDSNDPQLYDENREIIMMYANNQHLFSESTRPQMILHPKCLRYIDTIILGLIVDLYDIEQRKKRRRRQNMNMRNANMNAGIGIGAGGAFR